MSKRWADGGLPTALLYAGRTPNRRFRKVRLSWTEGGTVEQAPERRFCKLLAQPARRGLRLGFEVLTGEAGASTIRTRRSFPKQRYPTAARVMQCFRTSGENKRRRMHSIAPLATSGLHNTAKR